jgi:hypothetical protein
MYCLIISVKSFFALLFRIYIVPKLQVECEQAKNVLVHAVARLFHISNNPDSQIVDEIPVDSNTETNNSGSRFLQLVIIGNKKVLKQLQYYNHWKYFTWSACFQVLMYIAILKSCLSIHI